jgi:hypothetical protein
MLHETSFQIINMYSISDQNRTLELLAGWCESDVDSEKHYFIHSLFGGSSYKIIY